MNKLTAVRKIQICLGILWLLDGLFQLQPKMFSSAFANQVIAPAGAGQPLIISGPIHFAVRVLLTHPAVFNTLFALIQLLIGILILDKKTVRIGLRGSVLWGLIVWSLGEGFAGLLGGNGSLIMGLPGGVIIYVLLALAVLPERRNLSKERSKPAFWLPLVWVAVWVVGAIFQLLPGQNTPSDVYAMVSPNIQSAPSWMASLDRSFSKVFLHGNHWLVIGLALIELIVGLSVFAHGRVMKSGVAIGVIISLIFWVVGQSLGGYYTGLMTDPGTAPLLIILGLSIFSCNPMKTRELMRSSWLRLEGFVT